MHIQLLHTSASLTINENWDPDVRDDMEMMLNRYQRMDHHRDIAIAISQVGAGVHSLEALLRGS